MSRIDKLVERCRRQPPPNDIKWVQLVSLMQHFGFTAECSSGSHYTFQHGNGLTVMIPKPHPDPDVKPRYIKRAIEALENVGAIEGRT